MTRKSLIISIITVVVIISGAFWLFDGKAPLVSKASILGADGSEFIIIQNDISFSSYLAGFTNDGTALRKFDQVSYKVAP